MTRDTWSGPAEYLVTPGATYPVPWPYEGGALALSMLAVDGSYADLAAHHWSVAPASSETGGTVTLTPAAMALFAGGRLLIDRDTPAEQGWAGVFSARERGIEAQLDVLAMAAQEAKAGVDRSLRFSGPVAPIAPVPGAVLVLDELGNPRPGPDSAEILQVGVYSRIAEAAARDAAMSARAALAASAGLPVSPMMFGAAGDGATDDTAALQAMCDYMAGVGGEIVIPNRTFVCRSPLMLPKIGPSGRRVLMRGQGLSSIIEFAGQIGDLIYAGDPVNQGSGLGWELCDFRVRGASAAHSTGIFLERANGVRVKRVWFERMQDAIRIAETYGARISECHATNIGRDFLRAGTRVYHLVMRENGAFGIGGYFLNLTAATTSLNVRLDSNDVEVCAGLVRSAGPIIGFAYTSNYMEQASGPIFDFLASVRGEISTGNTFQLSGAQVINNFLGSFDNNHIVSTQITWGGNAFPTVGNIGAGTGGSVQTSPKRVPVLAPAYVAQGFYDGVGYYKDPTGRVYLQGNATRDTNVAAPAFPYTLFTLAEGFRPAGPMTFAGQGTTTGITKIRITGTGDVIIDATATGDFGLGGISFMAAT